jgi:hypothetical protein
MTNKSVSGEEYKAMLINNNQTKRPNKLIIGIVAVVVLCGLSFYGGIAYQKGKKTTSTATASGQANSPGGRGFGGRMGLVVGQVTAISPASISVNNSRTGVNTTLVITSSTTITNNGQTDTVSDIKVGDSVLARKDPSNASQASLIDINPSFGGGAAAPSTNNTPNSSI